jgi:hypothetical protein
MSVVVCGVDSAVVTLELLLAGVGSVNTAPLASVDLTLAVFVICAFTVNVTVTVAVPPAAIAPRLQLSVAPDSRQDPWLVVWEVKVAPAGMLSLTITSGAVAGPAFEIASVYVALAPKATEAGPVIEMVVSGVIGAAGVTGADGADSGPFPATFVACTVKV